ncbi:MAG: V-type ATP synthase subunit I [Clostridium sp.]
MAIVKMNKFTLLAFESHKDELLKKLQEFSNVEFVNLQDESAIESNKELQGLLKDDLDSEFVEYEEELSKAKFALEFLRSYVPKKSGLKALKDGKAEFTLEEIEEKVNNSEWHSIYAKLKEKEEELLGLDNEKSKLQVEVEALTPWQNFNASFEELNEVKSTHFLGSIPAIYEEEFNQVLNEEYVKEISRDNSDIYYLIISLKSKEEVAEILRSVSFTEFKTSQTDQPLRLVHDFNERISRIDTEKFFIAETLANLVEEANMFEVINDYYSNIIARKSAVTNFLKTDKVTLIQGWNAVEDNEKVSEIVKNVLHNEYYLQFEDVKEEEIDNVPIKLKNNKMNSTFESITAMYSLPKYNEIDPTPLLAPFYFLFFGMMVADIGYGLLLLIGSLIAIKKLNLDAGMKKNMQFFFYLSIAVIFFGMIYGSFFGDVIPLPKLIDPQKDVISVIIAAVVFGIVQIFVGLGIKAYILIRDGKTKDAIYDVGTWVLTLVSLGVFGLSGMLGLPDIVSKIFMILMIVGMVSIVLTQGRHNDTIGGKLGQGLYGLYGITGYVSDIVSYTRLMALGLAGGSIAAAFNMIVDMFPGIAAVIIAPVIFIAAHIFNLALSLLGAYVHTCRLQYVEYFSKFYEGGGKEFKPFKTGEQYINIKKN